MSLESFNNARKIINKTPTFRESKEGPIQLVQRYIVHANVRGTVRFPEIHFPDNKEIEDALTELGMNPFPDGEGLVISSWHDIGILYEKGLVDFRGDKKSAEANTKVVYLRFPDSDVEGSDTEYAFPVRNLEKKFPQHSPAERREGSQQESIDAVDDLEGIVHDWQMGSPAEDKLHEYSNLPNLRLFKNNPYRWSGKKLWRTDVGDSKEPVLVSKEEQIGILLRAKNGDEKAQESMIKIHLGLVISIVSELQERMGGEADDMVQAGLIGLLKAVERFDVERGNSFSTLAVPYIDGYIRKQYHDEHRLIRIPDTRNQEVSKYHRTKQALEQRLGRSSLHSELALELGMNSNELDQFERQVGIERVIDGLAHDDQITPGHVSLESGEILPDLDDPVAREQIRKEFFDKLELILSELTPREVKILRLRFGIGVNSILSKYNNISEHMTYDQIAELYNVTKAGIRHIEGKALRKLRYPGRSDILEQFL